MNEPAPFLNLKLSQIVFDPGKPDLSFYDAYKRLLKQPLNVTDSFKLALLDFRIVEEIKAYQAARLTSYSKHGRETFDGSGVWTVENDIPAQLAISSELAPLLEKPFTTNLSEKIKLTKEMKMTGEEIRLLLDLVEI